MKILKRFIAISPTLIFCLSGCQGGGTSSGSSTPVPPPSSQLAEISVDSSVHLNPTDSETLHVFNSSTIAAENIGVAAGSLPAGVSSSTCTAPAEGGCDLTFTSNQAITTPNPIVIRIAGSNTNTVTTNLYITNLPPQQAAITVVSPVLLQPSDSEILRIFNSSSVAAENVSVSASNNLPAGVTSSSCNAPAEGSCDLTFTSNQASVTSNPVTINIKGTNTNSVSTDLYVSTIPSKKVEIYNNSPETIYPIIEMPKHDAATNGDNWLKAHFKTTDPNATYSNENVYRAYINPTTGIPPQGSVSIIAPLYSNLVTNPQPDASNQYLDWWNGGRIYLYDEKPNLTAAYDTDSASPVTTKNNASIVCPNCSEPVQVFSAQTGLSLADAYQLAEYTFGSAVKSTENGQTLWSMYPEYVDYDLSFVDHVYLPVAIEPYGNKNIGYTGSTMDLGNFRSIINNFIQQTGWPVFAQNQVLPFSNPRVPGAYNVILNNETQPLSNRAYTDMVTLWSSCINDPDDSDKICPTIKVVNAFFLENYSHYISNPSCPGSQPSSPSLSAMLEHVYGWVPFNEGCTGDNANSLTDLPDYTAASDAYHALQYDENREFNPFVDFIHGVNGLDMNAYAYSIDDAVGNQHELGGGLTITVGGPQGLANPNRFDPKSIITVDLGTADNSATWMAYGLNGPAVESLNGNTNFSIATVPFPCTVNLLDSNGTQYSFIVNTPPPLTDTATDIDCNQSVDPIWCNKIQVDTTLQNVIGTSIPKPASNIVTLFLGVTPGVNFKTYSVCNGPETAVNGTISFPVTAANCVVSLKDSQDKPYSFTIVNAPPLASGTADIGCTDSQNPDWCAGVQVNPKDPGYNYINAAGPDA